MLVLYKTNTCQRNLILSNLKELFGAYKIKCPDHKIGLNGASLLVQKVYRAFHVKWNSFLVKSDITDLDFDENWFTCWAYGQKKNM